jgi:hypothetical protein
MDVVVRHRLEWCKNPFIMLFFVRKAGESWRWIGEKTKETASLANKSSNVKPKTFMGVKKF